MAENARKYSLIWPLERHLAKECFGGVSVRYRGSGGEPSPQTPPPPSRIHGGISTVEVGIVRFHASVLQHLCSLQNAYIIHTNAGRHGPKVCAQPAVTCFYACLDTMVRHTVVGQQWNAMVSARLTLRKGSISKSKTKHLQKAANTHRV